MSELRTIDFPITYRGLVFNGARTTAGGLDRADIKDNFRIRQFDYSRVQSRDQREGRHSAHGGDLGSGTEVFRFLALTGVVQGSTGEKLEDRISALNRAFSLDEAILDAPSTNGVSLIDFYTPTEYSGTGVSGGVAREAFWARPASAPATIERSNDGLSALFACELVCGDILRYLYTAESFVFNAGNGWTRTPPNWNTTMGRQVYPVYTIAISGGAAAANFTMSDGTRSLVLDLSAYSSGSVVVDMSEKSITRSGSSIDSVRTSDADSFFALPAGGVSVAITNRTNITSVTAAYRQARA